MTAMRETRVLAFKRMSWKPGSSLSKTVLPCCSRSPGGHLPELLQEMPRQTQVQTLSTLSPLVQTAYECHLHWGRRSDGHLYWARTLEHHPWEDGSVGQLGNAEAKHWASGDLSEPGAPALSHQQSGTAPLSPLWEPRRNKGVHTAIT